MDIKSIYSLFIQCDGVTTDSRKCPKDSMFIALKGDNFDGNVFVENAIVKIKLNDLRMDEILKWLCRIAVFMANFKFTTTLRNIRITLNGASSQ